MASSGSTGGTYHHPSLPNLSAPSRDNVDKAAWLFPGQGTQQPGMGKDLFEESLAAHRLFEEADEVLGRPLSKVCFEGPDEALRRTENAQPAVMMASLACLAAANERGKLIALAPVFVAGHSLGEYSAAVAAGALPFAAGLRLVQERGRLMQLAGRERPGTMAAMLGLDEDAAQSLCKETGAEISNLNAPGQIVIGGSPAAVQAAIDRAKAFGARRAVQLNVSGAFHTSLMSPALDGMKKALKATEIGEPAVPIVANGSAAPIAAAGGLRDELLFQLNHPVQWRRSVEFMADQGVTAFVEFGPGEVLTGLARRIAPDTTALNFSSMGSLSV